MFEAEIDLQISKVQKYTVEFCSAQDKAWKHDYFINKGKGHITNKVGVLKLK